LATHQNAPSAAKAAEAAAWYGTAEAVPFQNPFMKQAVVIRQMLLRGLLGGRIVRPRLHENYRGDDRQEEHSQLWVAGPNRISYPKKPRARADGAPDQTREQGDFPRSFHSELLLGN